MSMETKFVYRGIAVYLKPSKKTANLPAGARMAGEVNFGTRRKFIAQQKTVEGMMFKARRLIDAELDKTEDVVGKWFRTALV